MGWARHGPGASRVSLSFGACATCGEHRLTLTPITRQGRRISCPSCGRAGPFEICATRAVQAWIHETTGALLSAELLREVAHAPPRE